MSLILTTIFVAGGVAAGRFLARAARRAGGAPPTTGDTREDADAAHADDADAKTEEETKAPEPPRRKVPVAPVKPATNPFEGFPCQLGDVILALGTDEAWLAGAILLLEEAPAAALFIAPDAGGDRAVLCRPRPSEDIVWLSPLPLASSLAIGAEPPSSLEHDGERFERQRRLPFRAERHGSGAPDVGDSVVLAEYTSAAGDHLVVLIGRGAPRVWSGRSLTPGMYDVLASGKTTLEV